jgi:ribosomal protein S18 acetylase RimI-like enzyme
VNFHVRPVVATDEPFLWEALYHALYVPPGTAVLPRDVVHRPDIAAYVRGWGAPTDRGFLAEEVPGGQAIGAAWLRIMTGEGKGYGYVDDATPEVSVAVLPGYRGQGVGTRLLRCLLDLAAVRFPALSLSVAAQNPAVRLYRRLGFAVVAERGSSLVMLWRAAP